VDNLGILILVGMAVALVALVALERHNRKKRIEELGAAAARLGYEFDPGGSLLDTLRGFGLLERGHSHRTCNLLRGREDGISTTICDWHYEVGYGKSRRTYDQSVLLLDSQRLSLPAFALRPEGIGAKLLGALGGQDIDFEEQPAFSGAYVLQGTDERRIRALFGDAALAFFAQRPGLTVLGNGQLLLYYRGSERVSPGDIPAFVERGRTIFHLFAGAAAPAGEPDPLAGLDDLLAEMGVEPGAEPAGAASP
jgi:hypothetical protein